MWFYGMVYILPVGERALLVEGEGELYGLRGLADVLCQVGRDLTWRGDGGVKGGWWGEGRLVEWREAGVVKGRGRVGGEGQGVGRGVGGRG
jgi:hypothetical protein